MEEENSLIDREELRRKLAIRAIIYCTIGILVVMASSLTGIAYAEFQNRDRIAKLNINKNQEQEKEVKDSEVIEEKKQLLPVFSEEARERMAKIYEADSDEKIAYLTFDDGPSNNITPQILEILDREGIKATFFVLGSRVELYPELVKQEYEQGHYIANHSFSHEYSSVYASPEALLDEYNRTEKAIQEAIDNPDYHTYIFRFPGGSEGGKYKKQKDAVKSVFQENDILYINWNALTRDAEGKPTAESLVEDLIATVGEKKRVVVLMHDAGTKQLTADTLPEVIEYLREEGFEFRNFYDIMR